jgi:hypothetical protein
LELTTVVARLAVVCLISALFAGSFAGVVHLAENDGFQAQCRVSNNPACFGPNLR